MWNNWQHIWRSTIILSSFYVFSFSFWWDITLLLTFDIKQVELYNQEVNVKLNVCHFVPIFMKNYIYKTFEGILVSFRCSSVILEVQLLWSSTSDILDGWMDFWWLSSLSFSAAVLFFEVLFVFYGLTKSSYLHTYYLYLISPVFLYRTLQIWVFKKSLCNNSAWKFVRLLILNIYKQHSTGPCRMLSLSLTFQRDKQLQ